MSSVTLKLQKRYHTRSIKIEKFSFLLGGVILLLSAYNRYVSGGMRSVLFEFIYYPGYLAGGLVNIAAGVLYAKIPDGKKEPLGKWLQIIIALLLLFDAIDKLMKGKIAMPAALFFASLLYFSVALFSQKLKGRRFISLDENKVIYRRSLFKIRTIKFEEINDILFTGDRIVLDRQNKKSIIFFPAPNDAQTLKEFDDKLNSIKELLNKKSASTG